jgi:hypothetical protein
MSIDAGGRLSKGQKWPRLLLKLGLYLNHCNSNFYTTRGGGPPLARTLFFIHRQF